MTNPPDPRLLAALDAFDERVGAQGITMELYVSSGIVMALVIDPDEHPIDYTAAANRGDEVLATIGADIAREHSLPADWISQLNPRTEPTPAPQPLSRRRGRLEAILGRLRGLTRRRP